MDEKKNSMSGMTSAQKAAVLKGKQRMNKDKMAKIASKGKVTPSLFNNWGSENAKREKKTNRLAQGNVDMGRTIGRLESSKDRSARSATYRLAKMKAEKKMSKPSKVGKMLDDMDMKNAPQRPFISKAKKKDK